MCQSGIFMLESIEKSQNIELPRTYKEWFHGGGPKAKEFAGTDMDFPNLAKLRKWTEELFIESRVEFNLPENAFVFAMHQGYQLMYFLCDGTSDPEVWYSHEGDDEPKVKWASLSGFLSDT
jgi:hypothetical protein